jgi:hypothetical protein
MIDHVILNVTDLEVSKRFFAEALAPLGYAPSWEDGEFVAMGGDNTSACTVATRKVPST